MVYGERKLTKEKVAIVTVDRVIDGDTFVSKESVDIGNIKKYRLADVWIPEKNTSDGSHATLILEKLINKKEVRVRVRGVDRYDRLVAFVTTLDGTDVNAKMEEVAIKTAAKKRARQTL